jgi:Biopolymer transport protein ExbD/TolR
MAEINTATSGQKPGVRRGKKLSTRVDLTPMVDLGFLLITFFIFTTTMSIPQALDIYMPVDEPGDPTKYPESKVITVIPIDNNQIFYYHGLLTDAVQKNRLGICGYDLKSGIGSIIRHKQTVLDQLGVGRKELTLIIRPGASSTYRNTTDLLDEVLINELKYYSLADLQKEEIEVLKQRGIDH